MENVGVVSAMRRSLVAEDMQMNLEQQQRPDMGNL